jgi:ABC-type transporter Mla subunit MlaD
LTSSPNDPARFASLKGMTRPLTAYFDKRFEDLHGHIDHRLDALEARLGRLETAIGGVANATKVEAAAEQAGHLDAVMARVERFSGEFAARAERIADAYEELARRARDAG